MKSPHLMSREELEEEVLYLRGEMCLTDDEPTILMRLGNGLRLQPGEVKVALGLYRAHGRLLTSAQLQNISPAVFANPDERCNKIVAVWVSRIRSVLGYDSIETEWGVGYAMTPSGLKQIKEILEKA